MSDIDTLLSTLPDHLDPPGDPAHIRSRATRRRRRRLSFVAVVAVAGLAGLAVLAPWSDPGVDVVASSGPTTDTAPPPSGSTADAPAVVRCTPAGLVVESDAFVAGSAGVDLVLHNERGAASSLVVGPGGDVLDAGAVADMVATVAPGPLVVSCSDATTGELVGSETVVTVQDPDGHWLGPAEPTCVGAAQLYPGAGEVSATTPEAAADLLVPSEWSGRFERRGYAAADPAAVALIRDSRVVAVATVGEVGDDAWSLVAASWCPDAVG
jgi:hypothetical protein